MILIFLLDYVKFPEENFRFYAFFEVLLNVLLNFHFDFLNFFKFGKLEKAIEIPMKMQKTNRKSVKNSFNHPQRMAIKILNLSEFKNPKISSIFHFAPKTSLT